MKDYENNKKCTESTCEYFDERMELNCAYSEDNSECIKTIEPHLPKADAYSLLAEVRAVLGDIVEDNYRIFEPDSMDINRSLHKQINELYKKISERFS